MRSCVFLLTPSDYLISGIKQKEQFAKQSISTLAKQQDDIRGAYSSSLSSALSSSTKPAAAAKKKKRVGLAVQPNRGVSKSKGKIAASSADWTTAAAAAGKSATPLHSTTGPSSGSAVSRKSTQYLRQQLLEEEQEASKSPRRQLLAPVKLSDFLLLDIPLGMADKLDRLLYAAALRCFVPDFFPHHSLHEAYALYRQMPNGLTKVRYEQCAYSWSQPLVSKLRLKGLSSIADLMPISKCDMFLRGVGTPLILLDTAKDIIAQLQSHDQFTQGLPHQKTKDEAEKLLALDTVSVFERPRLISRPSESTNCSLMAASHTSENHLVIATANSPQTKKKSFGIIFAENFLSNTVKGGAWCEMSAPVDELLLHAAFLICPNVPEVSTAVAALAEDDSAVTSRHSVKYQAAAEALGDGYKGFKRIKTSTFDPEKAYTSTKDDVCDNLDVFGNEKDITLHGHDHFLEFSQYLQLLAADSGASEESGDSRQREAIRERYRTALLLSTPFELNLKAAGVNTVAQLARWDMSSLELPPLYKTQIESMISTAIAASMGVKEAENVNTGKHLPPVNNQIAFKVPLVYNNKFQRGPFDPYGIPPRMDFPTSLGANSIAERQNKKNNTLFLKKKKPQKSSRSDIDAPVDLPTGLWSRSLDGQGQSVLMRSSAPSSQLSGPLVDSSKDGASHGIDMDAGSTFGSISQAHDDTHSFMPRQQDLSKGRSVEKFFLSLPAPREARQMRDQKEHEGSFERPYKCSHVGCAEAFSRPYTLRMHEKSHLEEYRDYMKFRRDPQYALDADSDTQAREDVARFENAVALPQYIQQQLDSLRLENTCSW